MKYYYDSIVELLILYLWSLNSLLWFKILAWAKRCGGGKDPCSPVSIINDYLDIVHFISLHLWFSANLWSIYWVPSLCQYCAGHWGGMPTRIFHSGAHKSRICPVSPCRLARDLSFLYHYLGKNMVWGGTKSKHTTAECPKNWSGYPHLKENQCLAPVLWLPCFVTLRKSFSLFRSQCSSL